MGSKTMAINLIKAGFDLGILIKSTSAKELVKLVATAFGSIKALSENNEIVITMLPDSPDVELVVLGENGVLSGLKPGSLFIDMSSISPAVAIDIYAKMKEKGIEALDAPASGGQVGAEAATLSIMVGGTENAFNQAMPIFSAMGKNIVLIGEAGACQ